MLSAVYQLGTTMVQANFDKDSGNRLYWRANRIRLDGRAPARLGAVRGRHARRQDGRTRQRPDAAVRRAGRSTARVSRYRLDEFLQLFDYPSPMQSAEKRFTTNVPLQRLFLMNSDFMQQQAERLADRVIDAADRHRAHSRRRIG